MILRSIFAAHAKSLCFNRQEASRSQTSDSGEAFPLPRNLLSFSMLIPGLTNDLQPLSRCINKPFKERVRQQWLLWMQGGGDGDTKEGNLKKASIQLGFLRGMTSCPR